MIFMKDEYWLYSVDLADNHELVNIDKNANININLKKGRG